MRFSKTNVTLTGEQLFDYMTLAWRTCWETIDKSREDNDRWPMNDYVTASDIESCVRWLVDRDYDNYQDSSTWWGYQGWSRIRVKDGDRGSLLSRCQTFLYNLARDGSAVAHNFGRGHISGARYRRPGAELNKAEKKTLADKTKERPVHYRRSENGMGKPLCTANRKRTARSFRHRNTFNPKIRLTRYQDNVTCPRCKNLLEKGLTD